MSSAAEVVPVPARRMIYLGMDVHKESIAIAVLPADAKVPARLDRLPNDLPKLRRWIEQVARDGEVRACYEASGAGHVLHRALVAWAAYWISLKSVENSTVRRLRLSSREGLTRENLTPTPATGRLF